MAVPAVDAGMPGFAPAQAQPSAVREICLRIQTRLVPGVMKLLALGAAQWCLSPHFAPQALTSCHLCTTGSQQRGQRRPRTAEFPSAPRAPRCSSHLRCTEGLQGEGSGVSTQQPLGLLSPPLAPQDLPSLPAPKSSLSPCSAPATLVLLSRGFQVHGGSLPKTRDPQLMVAMSS